MKTNDSLEPTMIRGVQRKMRDRPVHSICPPQLKLFPNHRSVSPFPYHQHIV